MGKIRSRVLGLEEVEKEQKEEQKKRSEEKKAEKKEKSEKVEKKEKTETEKAEVEVKAEKKEKKAKKDKKTEEVVEAKPKKAVGKRHLENKKAEIKRFPPIHMVKALLFFKCNSHSLFLNTCTFSASFT